MADNLMPGPHGRTPAMYEVDKGHKTESYIVAIRGNKMPAQDNKRVYYKKPDGKNDEPKVVLPTEDNQPDDVLPGDGLPPPQTSPLLGDVLPEKGKSDEKFGYTLSELEQYKSDPFWRTLRWFLFIVFWLLWILMFLAAILIVIFSPGCAPKYVSPWWQNAVAYQIWTPSFQDSDGNGIGDFAGIISRLEDLRRIGVQAVWPVPVLISDNFSDSVRDHLQADSKLGTNTDVEKLIDAVHDREMKFVMSMPIAVTSIEHDWFYRSSRASKPEYSNFSDYYTWRTGIANNSYNSFYPNTSIVYVHYENRPDLPVLHWESASVRRNMFDILSYWIDKGVDGFYLKGIEYLARNNDGNQAHWPAIHDILRDIRYHVDTYAKESRTVKDKTIILFGSRENAKEEDKKLLLSGGLDSVIDYELHGVAKGNKISSHAEATIADGVHELVSDVALFHSSSNTPAMWEFGSPDLSRTATRVQSQSQAELLTIVQLLLRGTSSIYYGEEIGMMDLPSDNANESHTLPQRGAMQWDDSANGGFSSASTPLIGIHPEYAQNNFAKQRSTSRSHLKTFQKLARLRNRDETLCTGDTHISNLIESGFVITRLPVKSNNTVKNPATYIGAVNFGSSDVILPLNEAPDMVNKKMNKAIVIVSSSNAGQYYYRQEVDLSSGSLKLSGEHGVVFKIPE